jgi:hypothetical protein
MPNITKINSKKGLVSLNRDDLVEHDVLKWVRTESKGIRSSNFIETQPIESVAAKLYAEAYPDEQVKIAEKLILNDDTSVDVVLRVAKKNAENMYTTHPVKLVFTGKQTLSLMDSNFNVDTVKNSSVAIPDAEFLIEHIAELNENELEMLDEYLHLKKSSVEVLSEIKK